MKPVLLILSALLLISCKKRFTCTCYTSNGAAAQIYERSAYSQKSAKAYCDTRNTAAGNTGGYCDIDSGKTKPLIVVDVM